MDTSSESGVHITNVYDTKNGVALCAGSDDKYYVGLGYKLGDDVSSFENPQTDFCETDDLRVAQHYFFLRTGGQV